MWTFLELLKAPDISIYHQSILLEPRSQFYIDSAVHIDGGPEGKWAAHNQQHQSREGVSLKEETPNNIEVQMAHYRQAT